MKLVKRGNGMGNMWKRESKDIDEIKTQKKEDKMMTEEERGKERR